MSALNTFLRGIRVLDLSQNLPGPIASLFLSDMGASVLKIEPPGGDDARRFGTVAGEGSSAIHQAVNAGKHICRLDLKSDGGRREMLQLVENADVLIEGYRPGVMRRLGLEYSFIRQRNPSIIYCSISGYGQHRENPAGHDANYLAEAGVLARNGFYGPSMFDPPVADCGGAMFAMTAILGALVSRAKTGEGCHLDLALADSVHPLQIGAIAEFSATGQEPTVSGSLAGGALARNRIYKTAHGFDVVLCAIEPKFWQRFCDVAARPEWVDRMSDALPQTDLSAEVSEFFLGLQEVELARLIDDPDLCLSRINTLTEAMQRALASGRGLVVEKRGVLQPLFPVLIDGQRPAARQGVVELPPNVGVNWEILVSKR
ncbi:CaiB/BaiF CoA transferase family protein [Pontitalea aquivivens]|uniref:CaiB/BaiF CoA transferase family protein n=1 Tax=Pontitalea aquivivens TaxID=3388663 RepID=UPI003970A392